MVSCDINYNMLASCYAPRVYINYNMFASRHAPLVIYISSIFCFCVEIKSIEHYNEYIYEMTYNYNM